MTVNQRLAGKINLGLVCMNETLRKAKPEVFCSRTMTRANFTIEKAKEKSLLNVRDVSKLVEWNQRHGIKCFRLSSDIFPHFTDKMTEPYSIDFAREELKKVGAIAKKSGQRIVMHPGQYNQVGAKIPSVFESTISDLSHHADILDIMEVPTLSNTPKGGGAGVLIVHGGGTYGDKPATKARWITQFELLPENVKKRLAIENDETGYNVSDCLEIAEACNIPVVYDCHHYECFQSSHETEEKDPPMSSLIKRVYDTWRGTRPLMHISSQAEGARLGAHGEYIIRIPEEFLALLESCPTEVDLEVEAKRKEQAIFSLWHMYPELFPKHKVSKVEQEELSKLTQGKFLFEVAK